MVETATTSTVETATTSTTATVPTQAITPAIVPTPAIMLGIVPTQAQAITLATARTRATAPPRCRRLTEAMVRSLQPAPSPAPSADTVPADRLAPRAIVDSRAWAVAA